MLRIVMVHMILVIFSSSDFIYAEAKLILQFRTKNREWNAFIFLPSQITPCHPFRVRLYQEPEEKVAKTGGMTLG